MKSRLSPQELAQRDIEADRRAHDPVLFKLKELVQKVTFTMKYPQTQALILDMDLSPERVIVK